MYQENKEGEEKKTDSHARTETFIDTDKYKAMLGVEVQDKNDLIREEAQLKLLSEIANNICPLLTSNEQAKSELKIPKRVEEKVFECHVCKYRSLFEEELNIHALNHIGVETFECKYCPFKSHHYKRLGRHLESHSVRCKLCDFKVADNSLMKDHSDSHTEEKLYKCNVCTADLKQHTKKKCRGKFRLVATRHFDGN